MTWYYVRENYDQSKDHFGKPCIAGTRITEQNVLELLNGGLLFDRIIQDYYPDLTVEDMRSCIG